MYFLRDGRLCRFADGEPEVLIAWSGAISSYLPLSDSVVFLAEDELEGEGVRVWSESLRPTRLRVLDLETERIRTLGEEHVVAVAQQPDGGPLAVITWSSPELDPGALEARLSSVDLGTGTVRDLGRAGIDASSPVWWQAEDGWHVAYLAYLEPAGGLAVFDVAVESGEHRNLTADMDACPIELVQAASGAPWVVVAEGLDTGVRRLGADDILTVAGQAESLAVRGELVAMIVSTAHQPKEVHCGLSPAPLSTITDLGRELSGISWGSQERLAYEASDDLSLDGLLILRHTGAWRAVRSPRRPAHAQLVPLRAMAGACGICRLPSESPWRARARSRVRRPGGRSGRPGGMERHRDWHRPAGR
jgi:hypothetical protein